MPTRRGSRRAAPAGSGPSCWARAQCAIPTRRRWPTHSRPGSSARDSRRFPGARDSGGCASGSRSFITMTARRGPTCRMRHCSTGSRAGSRRMHRGCAASRTSARSTSPRCSWPISPGSSGRRSTWTRRRTSRCRAGRDLPIDYADPESPVLAVRLQEMFGLAETPRIARGRVPLTLHLLSPAHRPVQVTRDLGGFWRSSYHDVRKDLRGRYPKHVWPEDPLTEAPTRRAKPGKR